MDHTSVGLRAAVRALADVVSPAVDPNDARAKEQLRLAIDYIEFVLERLDFFHDRELFDLRHHLEMAEAVQEIIEPLALPEAAALGTAIERGVQTLPQHRTPVRAMKDTTAALAAAIAAVVREAPRFDKMIRTNIEQCVLRAGKARFAFERSWYLPLGLDPDPGEVRPLRFIVNPEETQ
jgi:hypothetical protein